MKKMQIPTIIDSYNFVRTINNDFNHRSFVYALYRSLDEKLAFAKIWKQSQRNFDLSSLVNERNVYILLNQLDKRLFRLSGVYVPKYLGWKDGDGYAALLIEMIWGRNSDKATAVEQYQQFLTIRRFLRHITPFFKKTGAHIESRSHKSLILFFPILLILSLKRSDVRANFIKLFFGYLSTIGLLFVDFPEVVAHRSIEPKNIICKKNKIYMIDFQLTVLSNELSDVVQTLFFCWTKRKLCSLIINDEGLKKTLRRKNYRKLFRLLLLFTGVHQSVIGSTPKAVVNGYLRFCLDI